MIINLIAFDADDTLWHTEVHYRQAMEDLKQLLSPWAAAERIERILDEIIIDNLPWYGYGIKAFILSLIEAALHISGGEISGSQVDQILSFGKTMLESEVVLRPHVAETLQKLAPAYKLMIITKGDLLDQTVKVKRSGVRQYFAMVEVVNDKTIETYTDILEKYGIEPKNFLMVGNTIRSDIDPVITLGGSAVHIPADATWEHEMIPDFDTSLDGYYELDDMGQLCDLIARLSDAD
jgi:putative hydrolase of the HAD superfamily